MKNLLKVLVSLIVFVGTLFLTGYFMNKGNVNTTKDMEMASLPVIYMNVAGENVNELFGYVDDVEVGLLRENITPLDDNRGITFRVLKYGRRVNAINVKIRTADGSRLIESIDVTDYDEDDFSVSASISFKDLIEQYKEYCLEIYLDLGSETNVMYHTRVIDAPSYCPKEKLAFVLDFHKKSLSKEKCEELKTYMESNYQGDNSSFAYVNIHSSMDQLSFGELTVSEDTTPIAEFKELASETAVFTIKYIAKAINEGVIRRYFVEEYYRIKYTTDVTYLLDFERTMHQIPDEDRIVPAGDVILLGIADPDVGITENEDGSVVAFSIENKLYSYNINDNEMTKLFSFYDNENFDSRTYDNRNRIEVLRVDEAGNVWFVVSGYMNRGTYEGKVGIAFYEYNGVTNVIEEIFFVGSDQSPEIVMKDLEELSYLSRNGIYYFMLNRAVYAVDVENVNVECIVSGLEENMYNISESKSMMVWQQGDNINACESLMVMNLNTKQISEIEAAYNEYIKPLAFMGEDFIYGLAYKDDVITDGAGHVTFPMHCMKIQNEFGEMLKLYDVEGVYITDVIKKGNLLTLMRVTKRDSEVLSFARYEDDYMTNNKAPKTYSNVIEVVPNGIFENVVQIRLMKEATGKTVWLTPKEVIYEGSREVVFERAPKTKTYYYVYYKGRLQSIMTNEAKAVTAANDNFGTVLNDSGFYVWYRANRDLRNQIMDLTIEEKEPDSEPLTYCLDKLLEYEGIVRNSQYLISRGGTVLSILNDNLQGMDVLDLTGCSLDSVLYYVNRDIPVLAMTNTADTYLIIGFNQLAVVVTEPKKGTYKLGINEAEKLFLESGNQFITFVPNS